MNSYETFRYLMYRDNIRKADVIRGTGISRPTLIKWEKGKEPTLRTLRVIADFFNVPVTEFIEEESEE